MERAELKRVLSQLPCAQVAGEFVFLCDPHWPPSAAEPLQKMFAQARGSLPAPAGARGWLCIPTGGTSGSLRFARHDEETLQAAVAGFARHFDVPRIHAVGVLPLYHVSGLLAFLRANFTGGNYVQADWKTLSGGAWPEIGAAGDWFISLVPTQLQRLLETKGGPDFLRRFHTVLIGGGPIWPALADAARAARIPVALSYGMTETAAMVCAQRAADFAAGARDAGVPLPHARVRILREDTGEPVASGDVGQIEIAGLSVMRGYFPNLLDEPRWLTEDLGRLTERGTLEILGRRDAVIITGGKKVSPADVELALRDAKLFSEIAVIGIPDAEWGEVVVACYPAGDAPIDPVRARAELESRLASYELPKKYVAIANWPRNAQGKLNRTVLKDQCRQTLGMGH